MAKSSRNLMFVAAAITAVVAAALITSQGQPSIEHPPTPTAEEIGDRNQRWFDETAEHDKLRVSDEIGVYYLWCDPPGNLDPRAEVLVVHIRSGSWHVPHPLPVAAGDSRSRYESEEAKRAIEEVVSNQELMDQILERSPKPARCPAELAAKAASFMDYVNDYDQLDVTDDIRVHFDECASDGEFGDLLQIFHMPTMSNVVIERFPGASPQTQFLHAAEHVAAPSARARLQEIVSDEELIAQIWAAENKALRCPENPTWYKAPDG